MSKKIIIALGGNALQQQGEAPTYENQMKNIRVAVLNIIKLIKSGYEVIITHGNGPQIGRLLIQNEAADSSETPSFPFDAVSAISQSTIGYQIVQCLQGELKKEGIDKGAVMVLSQVEISENDDGFKNPSKPIGPYYNEEEAKIVGKEKGYLIKEDSNRGYRRMVASPNPINVIEKDAIKKLTDEGNVVVCCGGGGIPVIKRENYYEGAAAVIDKDKASALLAKQINADYLVILTAVKEVALNFGKENEKFLNKVSINELNTYKSEGHFAPGSMLPKVEAVVDFVEDSGKTAVITTLENAYEAIVNGDTGTIVN